MNVRDIDSYQVQRADGPVIAEVVVPPSKSIVNRALVCAALARAAPARSVGVAPGDDTAAMIGCLQQLGCGIGVRLDGGHRVADVMGTGAELVPGPMAPRRRPGRHHISIRDRAVRAGVMGSTRSTVHHRCGAARWGHCTKRSAAALGATVVAG